MLKHYVKIFRAKGDCEIFEVLDRDKNFVMRLARKDKTIFTYCFFDRNEVVAEDGELLPGEKKNFSKIVRIVRFELSRCVYEVTPGNPKSLVMTLFDTPPFNNPND